MPEGLFAKIQVAHLPFALNWQHLPSEPRHFLLEVGANNHELERDDGAQLLQDGPNAFLLSFEPLLDKYSYLLSFSSAGNDLAVGLGLQHRRGIALPYAVGQCGQGEGGTATFHVSPVDGCSSLRPPAADFELQNRQIGTATGMMWNQWVVEHCARLKEKRSVPCVSLDTVVGKWLGARPIVRTKVDAQGSDLDVIKSAGEFLDRLLFVSLEVSSNLAAPLYNGQASCDEVLSTMQDLGFLLADARRIGSACNLSVPEGNLDFVRREVWPLWRSFYKDYAYCDIFSAAGDCGGPHCVAPRIRAQVNRTGGCHGEIQDVLSFEASPLGMVQLQMSPDCVSSLQIHLVPPHIQVWIRRGPVKRPVCSVQSQVIVAWEKSRHRPMRFMVRSHLDHGKAINAKSDRLILNVLLAPNPAEVGQSFTSYLNQSVRFRRHREIFWPCGFLMKSALWSDISKLFVATVQEDFCLMDLPSSEA